MTVRETQSGTPVVDLSPEEYGEYLESEVHDLVGMTVDEFVDRYKAGELDESDPAVSELVGLLRIGQSGQTAVPA
jgi:hypothetical protein